MLATADNNQGKSSTNNSVWVAAVGVGIVAIAMYFRRQEMTPSTKMLIRAKEKIQKKDLDGALEDFNEAIRLDPKNVGAYNDRGYIRVEMGDNDEAMADYGEAIRLDSKCYPAYHNRGLLRKNLGFHEKALKDLNKAVKLNSKTPQATLLHRGHVKELLEDFDGAMADYDKVIHLDKNNREAYKHRSTLKQKLGDEEGAEKDREISSNLKRRKGR